MTTSHGSRREPRNCLDVGQIKIGVSRCDKIDAGLIRKRANLRPNLASSTKKKNAHPSRTLRRQATAAGGVMFR